VVSYHLPCHWGASPGPLGGDQDRGASSSQRVRVRASNAQQNPLRCRNRLRSTDLHTGKSLGSNSGLPQEAEGETDHLPETLVTACWGEALSLRFREQGGSTVPCESVRVRA
jgi:hypothetical protein